MSIIAATSALDILAQQGIISRDEEQSLRASSTFVLTEAMEAVESTPAFIEALAPLVEEITRRTAAQDREAQALRQDPRYVNAPEVTGVFVKQFWDAGDYLTEITREDFTVPLPYLVANRERLEEVRDFGDSDWLAFDLGLTAGHDGPFDVTDIEDSLSAWMEATEVSS